MTTRLQRPACLSALIFFAVALPARAQQPSAPAPPAAGQAAVPPEQARAKAVEDLVVANRVLVDLGVLDAYGHVSTRVPGDPKHFLMSRSLAPELVTPAGHLRTLPHRHDLDGFFAARLRLDSSARLR